MSQIRSLHFTDGPIWNFLLEITTSQHNKHKGMSGARPCQQRSTDHLDMAILGTEEFTAP
jgi:hypothetical protein